MSVRIANRCLRALVLATATCGAAQAVAAPAQCTPSWVPVFGQQLDGNALALAVFDDGSGPALYAGGFFSSAGALAANFIAKWDGATWSPLGGGMDSIVEAFTVFDDGTGAALYAGGWFSTAGGVAANGVARWDGTSWSALGSGLDAPVEALTVFDDGSGPALYAAGDFIAGGVAKWDGTSWRSIGSEFSSGHCFAVFDDGKGPALYAGGGSEQQPVVAKWDGASWSTLGSFNSMPRTLAVFDDGTGAALYAGGGVLSANIARWNGTNWSPLGAGIGQELWSNVSALSVFDDGSGSALYAGGLFNFAGEVAASGVAKWDGTSWSALGGGMDTSISSSVSALTVFDDGSGPALFAGSGFTAIDSGDKYLAKWGCPLSATCQTDLGHGNDPSVEFSICGGDLSTGTTATLSLTGIPAGATPCLLASTTADLTPAAPWFLVPSPILVVLPLPQVSTGSMELEIRGGGGPATGYLQFALQTGAGIRTSNALRLDLLP